MYQNLIENTKVSKRPKCQGVVYRGGCMSTILSKYRYGATITNRSFMDAASSPLAAKERLYQHRGKKDHTMGLFCVMKLNGYSGVDISDFNSDQNIMLMPGARFKVRSLYTPAYSEADMQKLQDLKSYIDRLNDRLERIHEEKQKTIENYQKPKSGLGILIETMFRQKLNGRKGFSGFITSLHESMDEDAMKKELEEKIKPMEKEEAEILTEINEKQAEHDNMQDGGFLFDFMQDRIKNHLSKDDFKSECKGNTTFLFLEELPRRGQAPHKRMDNKILDREDDMPIDAEMGNQPETKNSPSKFKNFFSALFNRKKRNRLERRIVDRGDDKTIKSIVDNLPKNFSNVKHAPPEKKNFFSALFNRKKHNRLERRVVDRDSGVENLPRQNGLFSIIKNFFGGLFLSCMPSHKVTWTDILTFDYTPDATSPINTEDLQNSQFIPEILDKDANTNEAILSSLEDSIISRADEPSEPIFTEPTDLEAPIVSGADATFESLFSNSGSEIATLDSEDSVSGADATFKSILDDSSNQTDPAELEASITPHNTKSDSTRLEDPNNDSESILQAGTNKKESRIKTFFRALFGIKKYNSSDKGVFNEDDFDINPVVTNLPKQNKKPKTSSTYQTPLDYEQLKNKKHLYNSEKNLNAPTTVAFH